ncbi:MAG: T9SS type A sorting domain-containing protein, partial [Balneolaceae bacterium]
ANNVTWTDIDDGYNVTQFYKVSINPGADDSRIIGGTQDNGSPYFQFDFDSPSSGSEDASSGDGATAYLGSNYAITSSQNGFMLKYDYQGTDLINFSYITPLLARDQQFIHPFVVNPTDENYLFYPEFDHLWKNDEMTTLPRNTSNSDGTDQGWSQLSNVNTGTDNHEITALAFSTSSPSNRLYFGGSDVVEQSATPVIRRLDNIDSSDGEISINISGSDAGSFVNDISVNPVNGNEVIAVMSNYSVKSIWHSSNGGSSWTDIEGNLGGDNGPSIRTAAIAATDQEGTYYFVGTSIGLFYTDQLNGASTVWTQVAEDLIENAIVSELDYRSSDHVLAVATHGRGLFVGKISSSVSNEVDPITESPNSFELHQNYPNPFNPSTNIEFTLASNSRVSLTVFDINGREVAKVYDQRILNSGNHSSDFNASNLASGTYIYRIDAFPINGGSPFTQSRTMTLIK